jgi:hypothetical protein
MYKIYVAGINLKKNFQKINRQGRLSMDLVNID